MSKIYESKQILSAKKTVRKLRESFMFIQAAGCAEIDNLAIVFAVGTGQNIPPEIIEEFKSLNLPALDFVTSNFLTQRGFKNLLGV